MTFATAFHEREELLALEKGRRTDPLLPSPNEASSRGTRRMRGTKRQSTSDRALATSEPEASVAAERRFSQFPGFAPLLEELEIAGWSSNPRQLSGNFHDWLLLRSNCVLVAVGHAVNPEPHDATEDALVVQTAWSAIRAHAIHTPDAGVLLSLTAQTLWAVPRTATRVAAAVALVDACGGRASVALAGDCFAWRVRAATCEPFPVCQPPLGTANDFAYLSHSFELSLRERLILAADDPLTRPKSPLAVIAGLSNLDAESHRRMTATDAVALVRERYEQIQPNSLVMPSASVAAIRRR